METAPDERGAAAQFAGDVDDAIVEESDLVAEHFDGTAFAARVGACAGLAGAGQ